MERKQIEIGQVWMVSGEDDPTKWKKGIIQKTRPMLVITIHGNTCNCVPITSSEKSKEYNKIFEVLPNRDILLLTQVRTVAKSDFKHYMYSIELTRLMEINFKIASMLINPENNWDKAVSMRVEHMKSAKVDNAPKSIPEFIKNSIKRDYREVPMNDLLAKYSEYNISKKQVYMIVTNTL